MKNPEFSTEPNPKPEVLTPEQEQYKQRVAEFLAQHVPVLSALSGVPNAHFDVGLEWATNLKTGRLTIGIKTFMEQNLDIEDAINGVLHELNAHFRELLTEPDLTRQVIAFSHPPRSAELPQARQIFHNILADIAGNNTIHSLLPDQERISARLYREKLFPDDPIDDMTTETLDESGKERRQKHADLPRHLQFLYKLMREEMIPGSETIVKPEVDELIAHFRDFNGAGDLIKYSTQVSYPDDERVKDQTDAEKRFDIWTKVIYPEWFKLFEMDLADPKFQKNTPQGQPEDQSGEPEEGDGQSGDQSDFGEYYDDYFENKHPSPMTEDEHKQIENDIKKYVATVKAGERKNQANKNAALDPQKLRNRQFRTETGHSLAKLNRYNSEIEKWREQINALRETFRKLLNESVGVRRKLHAGHEMGAILTPETLAQTAAAVRSGHYTNAFSDYERRISERELTSKTDYIFAFDVSGSMRGEPAAAAASSAVICLEALSGMQRDIERMRDQNGISIDVDIRTAIYTFASDIYNPKPLSSGLSTKERLDSYSAILSPGGGVDSNSKVFQIIKQQIKRDPDRNQIIIVVSDGSDDIRGTESEIRELRGAGFKVYGLSVITSDAVAIFAPHGQQIDDSSQLPTAMSHLIEETI